MDPVCGFKFFNQLEAMREVAEWFPGCGAARVALPKNEELVLTTAASVLEDAFSLVLLFAVNDFWWRHGGRSRSEGFWRRLVLLKAIHVEQVVYLHSRW
jgi:hypothetical protein